MSTNYALTIAKEKNIHTHQVKAVIELLEEGGTVPFISRYRKERTGNLDEVEISFIKERLAKLIELDKRKEAILKSIEEQGKLTDELKSKIQSTTTLAILEDIYLPYKPKRKTKGSIAKEKGLKPLANDIFKQVNLDLDQLVKRFVNIEKGVNSEEEALQGARHIIAEWINENAEVRAIP
jgi:uncharacterized protein